MKSAITSFAFSLRFLNSTMNVLDPFDKSPLHSPQRRFPLLHLSNLSSDSCSVSNKYRKYQKTGHPRALPPNCRCKVIVGCPPVKAAETFLSMTSGSSVVNSAVSGLDDDIFPDIPRPGINLLWICAGL